MAKIMIVDDTEFMVKIARKNLEKIGHEVVSAGNGKECLDRVQLDKPDVILLDAEMPVMNGWDACVLLKSKTETKNIPVIMCTGDGAQTSIEKAKNIGAEDYILKPYDLEVMRQKIEGLIKK